MKFLKTTDREVIEETYNFYVGKVPRKPFPTLKEISVILAELSKRNPRAKGASPAEFVNMSFVRELDDTGYIDNLYKSSSR